MSLESALATDNNRRVSHLSPGRGRDVSLSPTNTGGQLRSISRGRTRGRSSSRRPNGSRAASQNEETNYRWSVLTHDPFERFEGKSIRPDGTPNPEDDYSDEEQISDDEADFDFDVNEMKLPNFGCSINDYYKRRSSTIKSTAAALERLSIDEQNRQNLLRKKEEMEKLSEALALEKGLDDAKIVGNSVPEGMAESIHEKLRELGIVHPHDVKAEELVKLQNRKNKTLDDYKKYIIEHSGKTADSGPSSESNKNIVKSKLEVNNDNPRVSRSLTVGDFFNTEKTPKDINTYIVYMDMSVDSLMALQYTIGSTASSGDVIYIINCSTDKFAQMEFYEKQVDTLTGYAESCLNLLSDPEFKLHIVIESTYRPFTKHFVNQLVGFLKPSLFVIAYQVLITTDKLANYITACPFQVIKRKSRRRSVGY